MYEQNAAQDAPSIRIVLEIIDPETVACYAGDDQSIYQDLYHGTLLRKCNIESIESNVHR